MVDLIFSVPIILVRQSVWSLFCVGLCVAPSEFRDIIILVMLEQGTRHFLRYHFGDLFLASTFPLLAHFWRCWCFVYFSLLGSWVFRCEGVIFLFWAWDTFGNFCPCILLLTPFDIWYLTFWYLTFDIRCLIFQVVDYVWCTRPFVGNARFAAASGFLLVVLVGHFLHLGRYF